MKKTVWREVVVIVKEYIQEFDKFGFGMFGIGYVGFNNVCNATKRASGR